MASGGYYDDGSATPFHLLVFLGTVALLGATSLYSRYESAVESLVEQVRFAVVLSPLLLLLAVLALCAGVWQFRRGQSTSAVGIVVAGLLIGALYLSIDEVPGDFTSMTPYVITLLVLAFASQRLRAPAAVGQTYRKGSAG